MAQSICNSGTRRSIRLIAGLLFILIFIVIKHLYKIRDPVYALVK